MIQQKNLIQLNDGYKTYGQQRLFESATFSLNEGEHVGVIGPNGAGKSTLFKILIGEEELDSGQIIRSQALRVGYLSQHDNWIEGETGNQYLDKLCRIPSWQAKTIGRDLQVSEAILDKPILSLSGGYRMRIKLLGLLGQDPNLMLLDEPTNYLDLETTLLLERFLQNYESAFLLISHDREVLRRTTDHTLEVESGDIVKYSGNIDDYFEQKELLRTQLEARAQNQALKKKAVMDFITRFGAKASKAKQAQSKMKSLEKMEVIELKDIPTAAIIKIPEPPHVGKAILRLENAQFGYAQNAILKSVTLEIKRGDHIAVVGLNGAGKSTLLKGLSGDLKPLSGEREVGYQVELAIFNQHVAEGLNPAHSVFESMQDAASLDVSVQEIRDMAGSLLFNSNSIGKKISVLSGGEKSRVALGRILLRKVPFLLLDEPTNHLDFQTVEALTQSLNRFSGTVIVVSHDRGFVRRVGAKILEVDKGSVHLYPGTYDEYVWSLQKKLASEQMSAESSSASFDDKKEPTKTVIKKDRSKEQAKELRNIERKIENTLAEIEKLDAENKSFNELIAAGQAGADLEQTLKQMLANTQKISELEPLWLELVEQREKF